MMRREASWLGAMLDRFTVGELDPVLSIGSGTPEFRDTFQPWISTSVYEPLERRSIRVLHHELDAATGIDVAGDLGQQAVRDEIRSLGVRAILCLNVLEHIEDRAGLAHALVSSLPTSGLLVVTVPRRFPYHADPIDTLYRPDPIDLVELFHEAVPIAAGTVRCESLFQHWLSKPGKRNTLAKMVRGSTASRQASSGAASSTTPQFPAPSLPALLRMAVSSTEVSYVVVRNR